MTALLLALALIAPAQHAPRTFVALEDVDPTILQDMRYATRYNFVGRRIDGYREPLCILTRGAARALERAQSALAPKGYTLKVYDCYRPQRAVDHFARWADDADDTMMKREFYPRLDKGTLHDDGYIAHRSGHSRGSAVDLTLVKLPPKTQPRWSRKRFGLVPCFAPRRKRFPDNSVSMGTAFDCFDPRAHTLDPRITGRPHRNRLLLRDTLDAAGFDD
jgi:D-alanyl-D-alanine dipeptidase